MKKKRIKIPKQDVEDHLHQHLSLSCAPVGGKRFVAGYLTAADDDETEILLQALHERSRHRLEELPESDSSQQPTTWTSSQEPTRSMMSESSSILDSVRNRRPKLATRGGGPGTSNNDMGTRDGIGLIDCIVFYLREVKLAFGRNCWRDHADSPGLGYHNYLPGTQCELPQLSYDGEAFKSSRSIDITYLRRRRHARSDCSDEFENLPHLFRGPAGAGHQMTHGGKMINQSIPKEVITPLMCETNANVEQHATVLVPHKGKLKMNWVKAIVTLPVQILFRPRRRRKKTELENTSEGDTGKCPNKRALNVDPDVTSLAAGNEHQKKETDKMRTKSGGIRRSDNGHLEENQHNGTLKRTNSPPIRKRMEEKQQHNGRLKRNQSAPIRKRTEEKLHKGQLKRSQSPPTRQRMFHLHPRQRTAAVVSAGDRQKVNKNAGPLDEQLQVSKGKGRQLHNDKKKMHHAEPRHFKRKH